MSELTWRHGLPATDAKAMVIRELEALGHEGKANWNGNNVTASVGWGAVLDLAASVQDEIITIDRCSGLASSMVLAKCRELLAKAFPGGEVTESSSTSQ